jgi:nifR3 family TIM-barrel protein
VTIKMRVGGDDLRYLDVARLASERGVGSITVHGRTQAQLYRGLSNHDAIRAVKEAVDVPVIGNGDIRSGADAKRMFEATGCDGVMVARGALGNPWLYREIETYLATGEVPPPPTIGERADVLRRHFALLREIYGDAKACTLVRRVITWFVKGAAGSASLRDRAQHVASAEEVEALIADFAATPAAP